MGSVPSEHAGSGAAALDEDNLFITTCYGAKNIPSHPFNEQILYDSLYVVRDWLQNSSMGIKKIHMCVYIYIYSFMLCFKCVGR